MAKRKRKTYKRYSPLSFISGFLSLGIAALIVATFFFPVFGYVHASDPAVTFNGGDYALFGLKTFIHVDDRFDNFLSLFETYASSGASYLLKPIAQFHQYIEIGVVAFFLFAVVFAAIEALLGVFSSVSFTRAMNSSLLVIFFSTMKHSIAELLIRSS